MLKQSPSGMKKVLAILLAVLFLASVTAMAVNAHGGGRGGFGWAGAVSPYWLYVGGNNWICPSYLGMPYTIQASAPAAPSPNLAGVAIFPETEPTPTNSTSK